MAQGVQQGIGIPAEDEPLHRQIADCDSRANLKNQGQFQMEGVRPMVTSADSTPKG